METKRNFQILFSFCAVMLAALVALLLQLPPAQKSGTGIKDNQTQGPIQNESQETAVGPDGLP